MLKKYAALLVVAFSLLLPPLAEGCAPALKQDAKTALTWTQTFCLAQNPDLEPASLAAFCNIDQAATPSIMQWLSVQHAQLAAASASGSTRALASLPPAVVVPIPVAVASSINTCAPLASAPAPAASAASAASSAPKKGRAK